MKIERWWKCTAPDCTLAYKSIWKARRCHHAKVEPIQLLIDDDGKPVSTPTKKQWRRNTDEDETFGLMSDLLGEI